MAADPGSATLLVLALTASASALGIALSRFFRRGTGRVPPPFSGTAYRAMVAAGMAAGRGNALTLEHVLIGLVKSRGIARSALEALGCDLRGLSRALRSIAVRRKYGPSGPLSPEVQRVLAGAAERAAEAPSRRVSSFVLLLGVLGQAAGPLEELLVREGIDPARVEALLQRSEAAAWRDDPPG